jgi:hypothetical protein
MALSLVDHRDIWEMAIGKACRLQVGRLGRECYPKIRRLADVADGTEPGPPCQRRIGPKTASSVTLGKTYQLMGFCSRLGKTVFFRVDMFLSKSASSSHLEIRQNA